MDTSTLEPYNLRHLRQLSHFVTTSTPRIGFIMGKANLDF